MDLLDRFLAQVGALQHVWMPFLLAVAVVVFGVSAVFRALYNARIARLEQDVKSEQGEVIRLLNRVSEFERELERGGRSTGHPSPAPAASDTGSPRPKRVPPPIEERVFLGDEITPEYLAELRKGKTSIQARRAIEPYLGKWMTIVGVVFEVTEVGDAIGVALETTDDQIPLRQRMARTVIMFFNEGLENVEKLKRGDEITVQGMLDEASEYGLRFDHSKLIMIQSS